jgi:hypothetical protein
MTLESLKARCLEDIDCWVYQNGATTEYRKRHPEIRHGQKTYLVRRLAYELAGKRIKDGMSVVPVCGNPKCVNPEHQKVMTESEKLKKAAEKGAFSGIARAKRIAECQRKSKSKLTAEQANEIRFSSESGPVLAARYGVNKSVVNKIKRGESWKDYSNPFSSLGARA